MSHHKQCPESSDRYQLNTKRVSKIRRKLVGEVKDQSLLGEVLSEDLRGQLESLPRSARKQLVDMRTAGCTPLTLACSYGKIEVVEYLTSVCDADIEKQGLNFRLDAPTTPLGCAIARRSVPVVECLIRLGANIHVIWNCGFTPLLFSCHIAHLETARVLVENGADLKQRFSEDRTCLMLAVRSASLCEFLIRQGVRVNARDMHESTALYYAISGRHSQTAHLLLDYGANPFNIGLTENDALRAACLVGSFEIAKHLMNRFSYSIERMADAHELIGAALVDRHNGMLKTMRHWRIAHQLRSSEGDYIQKKPMILPRSVFGNAVEFSSNNELDELALDEHSIRVQSLVILERQLGIDHWYTLQSLYSEALFHFRTYDRYIDALLLVMKERFRKSSFLENHCYEITVNIVSAMMDPFCTNINQQEVSVPQFKDVLAVFQILLSDIVNTRDLLVIRPTHPMQAYLYDDIVECLAYLMYILHHTTKTKDDLNLLRSSVKDLIEKDIRTTSNETLLHLCVSRITGIANDVFPSVEMTMLLCECGADVNAFDDNKSTPLHIASMLYNYECAVVRALIDRGAHLDLTNKSGDTARNLIQDNVLSDIFLHDPVPLRCLSANAIVKHGVPYQNILPRMLENFVWAHEP